MNQKQKFTLCLFALAISSALRVLVKMTVRLCDPEQTAEADARATFATVVPWFLDTGLSNASAEARQVCVSVVSRIAKCGGALLRPRIHNE